MSAVGAAYLTKTASQTLVKIKMRKIFCSVGLLCNSRFAAFGHNHQPCELHCDFVCEYTFGEFFRYLLSFYATGMCAAMFSRLTNVLCVKNLKYTRIFRRHTYIWMYRADQLGER